MKNTSAMQRVALAIRSGKLVRPDTCEVCGITPPSQKDGRPGIVGHHWRGYDYPLDVWWVCCLCNGKLYGPDFHNGSVTKEQAIARFGTVDPTPIIINLPKLPEGSITLQEASELYPLAYSTLAQAAREGRLENEWVYACRFTTKRAVEQAIADGKLNPRRK